MLPADRFSYDGVDLPRRFPRFVERDVVPADETR
jgi:hypothetical protein